MTVTTRLSVEVRAEAILNELARREKIGIEIGVYRGALSSRLLAADPTITLYMVDPWRSLRTPEYVATDDKHHEMTPEEQDAALQTTLERTLCFGKRAKILRMTSLEAADKFERGTLDFVFIDGDHSYAAVRDDIAAWWWKLVSGGLLSGHDYRDDKNYGVQQAVNEFAKGKDLRLGPNHTWFITKN